MVKLELGKRDSLLLAFVVVFVGVALVYAYGTSAPATMGHSAGEVEVDGVDVKTYIDAKVANLQSQIDALAGGGSVPTFDLVNGLHSSEQCTAVGGVVVTESGTGNKYCKFTGSCKSGWLYYGYSATTSVTSTPCQYLEQYGAGETYPMWCSCTTGGHAWAKLPVETCSKTCTGVNTCTSSATAVVTQSGCY